MSTNSTVKFKPLINTKTGVFCHLLEIGSTKIVIDCGIDNNYDYSIYDGCKQIIENADFILITSFNIHHIGALPLFPNVRTYCSAPTAVLGKLILEDIVYRMKTYQNLAFNSEINPTAIKFSQVIKVRDVSFTAFNAGHFIGNSIFVLNYGLQSLVIGYNINQRQNNYLDGASIQNIPRDATFILNSAYSTVAPYSLKSADKHFLEYIKSCKNKIIINVNFIKLLDLLCILKGEDVIIISKHGERFINQIKSMIEWTSSQSTDIFFEFKFKFGKLSDIEKHQIIIVIGEDPENSILGSVLDQCNSPDNTLILIDGRVDDYSKLKVYEYSYTLENIVSETAEENNSVSAVEILEEGNEDIYSDWTQKSQTIFLRNQKSRVLFPEIIQKTYDNDYGEVVNFNFEKKVETNVVKDFQSNEEIVIEHVRLIKEGITPILKLKEFNFYGVTDFLSIKTIMDGLNPRNIIIVNDFEKNSIFLMAALKLKANKRPVYICENEIEINFDQTLTMEKIDKSVEESNFIKVNDKYVGKAIIKRNDGLIEAIDSFSPIVLGNLKTAMLRKILIEKGFKIENDDNNIFVNDKLTIKINNENVYIESKEMELLANVRNILYEFIRLV